MEHPSTPLEPTQSKARIQLIDALRGFALLGILAVNMALFREPIQASFMGLATDQAPLDQAATWLVSFFATSKFYTLFSLLFGLGFSIMLTRARERGDAFVPFYLRRLLVLLGFGIVHAVFIWTGDILVTYALMGAVLLLFSWVKRPRTLLIWALALFLLPLPFYGLGYAGLAFVQTQPELSTEFDRELTSSMATFEIDLAQAQVVYRDGNFLAITAQRWNELATLIWPSMLFTAPSVLMMFLIGAYLGRREVFQRVDQHLPLFRRLLIFGLLVGVPANLIYASLIGANAVTLSGLTQLIGGAGALHIGGPAQSLAYVGAFALLSQVAFGQRLIALLAPVGQMALSNYLLQSIIATFIFYGYGLGLSGSMGAAQGLLLTFIIFGLQIPLSHVWMRRFRYGPAEWLWRTLTYMRPQPLWRTTGLTDRRPSPL